MLLAILSVCSEEELTDTDTDSIAEMLAELRRSSDGGKRSRIRSLGAENVPAAPVCIPPFLLLSGRLFVIY
jgi:hypothetical protein